LGLEGHSDADVVIHALCDAILGATGNGDIGQHFPNTDPKWSGADSTVFLKEVLRMTADRGYAVSNVDISLLAERPKLGPYFTPMRQHLAKVLGVPEDCVGLKATTNESLGAIGRGEGIAAFAVALLVVKARD
jgi:2-C-methyl-D-erythritol 2,4-cyclodiphosphate synthase